MCAIDDCIKLGEKNLHSVLSRVKTRHVAADLFCNPEIAFFNINTKEDYERAISFNKREEELCHW